MASSTTRCPTAQRHRFLGSDIVADEAPRANRRLDSVSVAVTGVENRVSAVGAVRTTPEPVVV